MTEAEKKRAARNLNPTPEARAAMFLWPTEYGNQRGGSMDYWDQLSPWRKKYTRQMLDAIEQAKEAHS